MQLLVISLGVVSMAVLLIFSWAFRVPQMFNARDGNAQDFRLLQRSLKKNLTTRKMLKDRKKSLTVGPRTLAAP
ncbi:MAG TPA: hypothetical protein HPP97_11855 [Desulfuromonadales bacterium]|nr:hypothetical protein [Desulfuromonadales bacterium]